MKSLNPPNQMNGRKFFTPAGNRKKMTGAMLLGSIAMIASVTTSEAVLRVTFNMRPVMTGVNAADVSDPTTVISPDGRSATVASGGKVVLELVATLNTVDADLTNDFFIKAAGSFISSAPDLLNSPTGSLRGDASTNPGVNNVLNFTGIGAKSGNPGVDLSVPPDGVTDVGGTSLAAFTNYFGAISNAVAGFNANSPTFILGETVLTLQSGAVSVKFNPRTVANTGAAANRLNVGFKIDGVAFNLNGDGAATTAGALPDPTAFVFNAATLTVVPEPSAFGMVFLGAMGLVGFRRLGMKKS